VTVNAWFVKTHSAKYHKKSEKTTAKRNYESKITTNATTRK